jgi:hypothetical protein
MWTYISKINTFSILVFAMADGLLRAHVYDLECAQKPLKFQYVVVLEYEINPMQSKGLLSGLFVVR